MENHVENSLSNNQTVLPARKGFSASAFRCFFKQQSISSTLSLPIRIAPAWSRMLRFGNTTKFKTDEFFEVHLFLIF